jgi:hypothetical protein
MGYIGAWVSAVFLNLSEKSLRNTLNWLELLPQPYFALLLFLLPSYAK